MKKFLSIFVAVAMVFSLFAGTFAPNASATTGTISDTTKVTDLDFWSTLPDPENTPPGDEGVLHTNTDEFVYKMGDTIHGTFVLDNPVVAGEPITVDLVKWGYGTTDGWDYDNPLDSTSFYQVAGKTSYTWQIGTGNVNYDGPYLVHVYTPDYHDDVEIVVYIQYRLEWVTKTIKTCDGTSVLEGSILRGNYTAPQNPVIVAITYPDNTLAASYFVAGNGSGQFSLMFPVTVPGDIGNYHVYVRDVYPDDGDPSEDDMNAFDYTCYLYDETASGAAGWGENDAMIYGVLSNVPTNLALTASTYYTPVLLYEDLCDQTLVLQLKDQSGAYVSNAEWHVNGDSFGADEISPGFYSFNLDIGSTPTDDIRFYADYVFYPDTDPVKSNTIVINLRQLGAFNPYLFVDADFDFNPQVDGETTRYVYDKLPCTIGNSLEVVVGVYPPADPANWYVESWDYEILGQVRDLGDEQDAEAGAFWAERRYIIEKAGPITATVTANLWERVGDCEPWFTTGGWVHGTKDISCRYWDGGSWISRDEMAMDACCRPQTPKEFKICNVVSCTLVDVSLEAGDQSTDGHSITVGKKANLVVNVSGTDAPLGLTCGCNTKIVHVYMTKNGVKVPAAFTMDTYAGGTTTVQDLWYNGIVGSVGRRTPDSTWSPDKYNEAGDNVNPLDDGTVTFAETTPLAMIVDNCTKLVFQGVKFNFVTEQDCEYNLVVQVFGLEREFDSCFNMLVSYPFISETINDINIDPVITPLTATGAVFEGAVDPAEILAGHAGTYIETTGPAFTLTDIHWSVKLNGKSVAYVVSEIAGGYKFNFPCAFSKAGTLTIRGYAYGKNCATMQEVTITKTVVMPIFKVELGLLDGSKIANDKFLTEGFNENIYVTATDPRAPTADFVPHDFNAVGNLDWNLLVEGVVNDCGLPTAIACGDTPTGCTTPSPITAYGVSNPNIEDAPQVNLYFTVGEDACAKLLVDTFTLKEPTVAVSPTEIPFTIPATATHVVFTVKDAHGHGAPDVDVEIEGAIVGTAGASGYNFVAGNAYTDANGEADWAFVPPYSGKYYVYVDNMDTAECFGEDAPNCMWHSYLPEATITAKYQAPVVDTTAPVVTITAGIDGSKVTSATLNLTGKVTDNVGVTQLFVGFNKVDILPDGSFMAALKLLEGENTITVIAYDAAGNKSTPATAKVTYTAPVDTSIVLVLTIGADIVSVNGMATSIDAAPEIVASRTFVPMRFIAEAFGATVEWLPETQGITITLGDHTVGLQIGNATAVVDGTIISLPAAPYIKNGRTMVPLRLISEAFGGDVVWDAATRTITITYQP